jgi:hypothetical protein
MPRCAGVGGWFLRGAESQLSLGRRLLQSLTGLIVIGFGLTLVTQSLDAQERVRRICIPNEDGSGWICGTEDDPPQRAAPTPRSDAPPSPPPFLVDPRGMQPLRPSPRRPAEVDVRPVPEPSPVIEPLPEPEPTPVEEAPAASDPAPEATPDILEPVPEPVLEPEPTPEPAPLPLPEPDPQPAQPPEPDPQPTPLDTTKPDMQADATVHDAEPVAPGDTTEPDPRREEAFVPARAPVIPAGPWRVDAVLGAGPDQWTLQLAHGPDASALVRLAGDLGLPAEQLLLLPLERDRARWWLLAWGLFDTPEQAREVAAGLRPVEGLRGVWPRRMEPMQNEIERARRTLPQE